MSYLDRVIAQARHWVNGVSVHNHIDNECCPDFSCCEPHLFIADKAEREAVLLKLLTAKGRLS